jgi:hypothetical protein
MKTIQHKQIYRIIPPEMRTMLGQQIYPYNYNPKDRNSEENKNNLNIMNRAVLKL